jgi:hypothetical protein
MSVPKSRLYHSKERTYALPGKKTAPLDCGAVGIPGVSSLHPEYRCIELTKEGTIGTHPTILPYQVSTLLTSNSPNLELGFANSKAG